jgi:hypothetical protein
MHEKISALDFSLVRQDVRIFLKPVKQSSLQFWDRAFFSSVFGKVFKC